MIRFTRWRPPSIKVDLPFAPFWETAPVTALPLSQSHQSAPVSPLPGSSDTPIDLTGALCILWSISPGKAASLFAWWLSRSHWVLLNPFFSQRPVSSPQQASPLPTRVHLGPWKAVLASSLAGRWMVCIFGSVLELKWVGTGGELLKRANLNLRVLLHCQWNAKMKLECPEFSSSYFDGFREWSHGQRVIGEKYWDFIANRHYL